MRNRVLALSCLLVSSLACTGKQEDAPAVADTAAGPCQLNLYNWSEYMDPLIIEDFERKFDCKVTTDIYEDNETMLAKIQGGGDSLYDVVVPGNYIVPVMARLGLLAELRHENIPNLANLDDKFRNPNFDPGNKYSVGYQWGTIGIYQRKSAAKSASRSWGLLLDADEPVGTFLMMDSIREMTGAALKYRGYSVNSTDSKELQEVRDLLLAAKNRSQGFEGGTGGKNRVLAKAVNAAIVYNGDAVRGMAEDADTEFFIPEEGGVIWIDNLAITAKAPHRDVAEKFINFILDPEVGARLSNFNQYATPNKASRPFITPSDLANPVIYPPPEMMAKLEFVIDVGDANKLYDEIWTQVKSK